MSDNGTDIGGARQNEIGRAATSRATDSGVSRDERREPLVWGIVSDLDLLAAVSDPAHMPARKRRSRHDIVRNVARRGDRIRGVLARRRRVRARAENDCLLARTAKTRAAYEALKRDHAHMHQSVVQIELENEELRSILALSSGQVDRRAHIRKMLTPPASMNP
jgi:hypothetical protein